MTPAFLSFSEVLEIHQDQIGRYGGLAGIRDLDLLKSALVFLERNNLAFRAPEDDLVEVVLNVAKGSMGKAALAGFPRKWAER